MRIRVLLLAALLGVAGLWLEPRVAAAFRLQTAATELADYALCMVGPTGPSLIRDNQIEFQRLVRRRLVAAAANERPFADCAARARDLTGSASVERAHRATAWSFAEYGGLPEDGAGAEASLTALQVSARPVLELMRRAWPLVRGGYTKLVRPSVAAREAVHPVELSKAAPGRGLPAWRAYYRTVRERHGALLLAWAEGAHLAAFESRDGGLDWTPTTTDRVRDFAERCVADEQGHWFSLSLSEDASRILVNSFGPEAEPSSVELGPATAPVFAVSCDRGALVAASKREGTSEVSLTLCPLRTPCSSLPLPRFPGVGTPVRFPLDVARVGGTTVIATSMRGIVRVASTRDDGRSWTPFSVAFDEAAEPDLQTTIKRPERLLVVGTRVLLYGGASKPEQTYPVLFSDDQGASFRTPDRSPIVAIARP